MRSASLRLPLASAAVAAVALGVGLLAPPPSDASSHREAPLIADDPIADNTDVYAFRTPDDPSTVTIVANYIPLSLPEGGPNYSHFGEDVRYEIHVKNQTSAGALGSARDNITYRFTFTRTNEDPTTFFNIRLGQQNLKTTYTLRKSTDGGQSFSPILTDGIVPPPNIGPRSIEGAAGLNTTYEQLRQSAVMTAGTGETVFAGPRDDPFFVDLGGIFDLGGVRQTFGPNASNSDNARDAVAGFNTHAIVLKVPIASLQKDGQATPDEGILDPDFVIGVWASASRPQIRTLSTDGSAPTTSGPYVQVSRLGMPLTNEAIIPLGDKDRWNSVTPYSAAEQSFAGYFANPELGLYMDNGPFGDAVPGLSTNLQIQSMSYPAIGDVDGDGRPGFDFNNGQDGVAELLPLIVNGTIDITGTAFAVPTRPTQPGVPTALVGAGEPRRVDILPIFYFGVPNLRPYQLATGKTGGPLSAGKPFIHNFLPITSVPGDGLYGGDMLRLNMATPVTDRSSMEFRDWARLGLIRAAALGLTDPRYNGDASLQAIEHMDGFPNGRRLEDDVTTIALQAVAGVVLSAVGLPEDDAVAANYSDLGSPQLFNELRFVAGPTKNDLPFLSAFPYLADPHRGYDYVKQLTASAPQANFPTALGIAPPQGALLEPAFPNPSASGATIRYHVAEAGAVRLAVYDVRGRLIQTLVDGPTQSGTHDVRWDASGLPSGTYLYRLQVGNDVVATRRATVVR